MIKVWLEYICWKVAFWMGNHEPCYPLAIQRWLLKHYVPSRHFVTWNDIAWWSRNLSNFRVDQTNRPLPWFVGPAARGPFIYPWRRIRSWFWQHTGGRSHRCEFTDLKRGALYGHCEGAFMDEYFNELLQRIDSEPHGEGHQQRD